MGTTKKRSKPKGKIQTYISVLVEKHDIHCDSGINPFLETGRSHEPDPSANVYRFSTTIEIAGTCIGPADRLDEPISITVYGNEFKEDEFSLKVKDFHALDDNYRPLYRKKSGLEVPVYSLPDGLGLLNRVRGKKEWQGWFRVKPEFAAVLINILNDSQVIYLALTECKIGRTRWIKSLSLQTTNPEEE